MHSDRGGATTLVAVAVFAAIVLASFGRPLPEAHGAPFKWPQGFEESKVEIAVETYEVSGGSAEEIWAAVLKQGPKDPKTQRPFVGYTKWRIDWRTRFQTTRDGCRIAEVRMVTKITTTLPEWVDRERADPEFRQHWDQFFVSLREHEEGHAQRAVRAAEKLAERIAGLPAAATCEEIDLASAKVHEAEMATLRAEQVEFDRVTNHGIARGAVLRAVTRTNATRG